MSEGAKTGIKWVLGLLIGAFFIWLGALEWPLDTLLSSGLELEGTRVRAGTVWSFDLFYLLPYFLILTAIHFLRVVRWAPLLRPLAPDVDFRRLNRVSAVGFMYLFILPLRLGELARPYLIADRGDIQMSEALGTVVVERVVDGLIVSIVLAIVLFFLPGQGGDDYLQIQTAAWLALLVFSSAMVVLVAAHIRRDWTLGALDRLLGFLSPTLAQRVRGLLESFLNGLSAIPNRQEFLRFVLYSLLYWALNGWGYYVLALGFSGLQVSLLAAYAMMCCVVVGMMLPNPPANVGVFWYFLLMPLTLYGVTAGHPEAIAFGLLAWLGQLVQQTLFGLYFLIQPGTPAGASARITDIASGGPHASPPSKDVYSG